MTLVALIDCNNFFVSCERLFRSDLAHTPVIVLSSNDGCVISRSAEAKALGLKMGEPYFKIRSVCDENKIAVFSSNFDLYRDLSRRVMATLRRFSDEVEVYSVDEAFLIIDENSVRLCEQLATKQSRTSHDSRVASSSYGTPRKDDLVLCGLNVNAPHTHSHSHSHTPLHTWGHCIRETVLREVGIPVSVGIAPTKTLAKVATHFAKKSLVTKSFTHHRTYIHGREYMYDGQKVPTRMHGYNHESVYADTYQSAPVVQDTDPCPHSHTHSHTSSEGVCVLLTKETQQTALASLPVEEIWGVGFRLAPKLKALGITTAAHLVAMDDQWIRAHMSIRGLRTVMELRGVVCFAPEEYAMRKTLLHSQSFGKPVTSFHEVRSAVAYHARKVAETLRAEEVAARDVFVTIRTRRHGTGERFAAYGGATLTVHSNDTLVIVQSALATLKRIYKHNIPYAKAGVLVSDIVAESARMPVTLFGEDTVPNAKLMHSLDTLRHRHGDVIRMGAEGKQATWRARHTLLSPRCTTRWSDIPTVRACIQNPT